MWEIHSDAETYRHAPEARLTAREQASDLLASWSEHWERFGFGYAAIRTIGESAVIGFAGARHTTLGPVPVLNLYYRFRPSVWGNGYAVEVAQAITDWAAAHFPDVPLIARVSTDNPASVQVAKRIGLRRTDFHDPDDPIEHVIFASRPLVSSSAM